MKPAVFISDLGIYSPYCIKISMNYNSEFQKTLQNLTVTQPLSFTGIKSIPIHLLLKTLEIHYGSKPQK